MLQFDSRTANGRFRRFNSHKYTANEKAFISNVISINAAAHFEQVNMVRMTCTLILTLTYRMENKSTC